MKLILIQLKNVKSCNFTFLTHVTKRVRKNNNQRFSSSTFLQICYRDELSMGDHKELLHACRYLTYNKFVIASPCVSLFHFLPLPKQLENLQKKEGFCNFFLKIVYFHETSFLFKREEKSANFLAIILMSMQEKLVESFVFVR